MSNSPLVVYTKLSPMNGGPRTHVIDTVTIHCMAGNLSVETCGQIFQSKEASSNYGIGSDGRIALYVDEDKRSWCSSNAKNDDRAVTIEVANTTASDPWPCSDEAYNALIELLTDICRRNGIDRLRWKGDKSLIGKVDQQNMTVHRWFDAKACPGDWLYNRHGKIASEVNAKLAAIEKAEAEASEEKKYEEFLRMYRKARDETDPFYDDLKDVPPYWKPEVEALMKVGAIKGDGVHEVGKRRSELEAMIPAARYVDWYFGEVPEK